MTPFVRSSLVWQSDAVKERIKEVQAIAADATVSMSWAEAKEEYNRLQSEEIWVNDTYQVNKRNWDENWIHLSIKSWDKSARHDWRELQQIKNELVGPEFDALELYPAEDRKVDTVNQFHLWVLADAGRRIPVGWTSRLVVDEPPRRNGKGKQRPLKN